jgi:hypothetical protein
MKVRELLVQLAHADPESEVLFLNSNADVSEANAVRLVDIRPEAWTRERGMCADARYEARYPGRPAERDSTYSCIATSSIRVVVLSAGPTNLRYTLS